MAKLSFVRTIFATIKDWMRVLMRRHCLPMHSETLKVIYKNPPMADMLMDVLDPEQLDDGMYFKVLQYLLVMLDRQTATQEKCLARMKIGDRASREGVTESYRMSMIKEVILKLPKEGNVIFKVGNQT